VKRLFKSIFILFCLGVLALIIWPEKRYRVYEPDAAYMAQAEAFKIWDMPPDWIWDSYRAADGTKLRWGQTGNSGAAKASVIIIPGYTATLDMYGEQIDMLARRGYHVIGIDMRGQGGSDRHRAKQPEKLWVKDFSVYSDDLAGFIRTLPRREGQPLIPVAISFGGHVAARMAVDHPNLVDGYFLMAPALRPLSGDYSFEQARLMMNVARVFGKAKHYVPFEGHWKPVGLDYSEASIERCSSNPSRLYARDALFARRPEQRVGGITNQWGAEMFESSDYLLNGNRLADVTTPVSIISAELDLFVDTAVNSHICKTVIGQCVEVLLAGTGHCLTQESDRVLDQIWNALDETVSRVSQ